MWQTYPRPLVEQCYDVQLVTGRVVRAVSATNLGNFARGTVFVLGSIVQKIRVSNPIL